MNKPCARRGCPEVVGRGISYCAEHAPPPWQGSQKAPAGWAKIRSRILIRDRYECQTDMTGAGLICGQPANQVDHIIPRFEGGTEDSENLTAICDEHHRAKTQMESQRARARGAAK